MTGSRAPRWAVLAAALLSPAALAAQLPRAEMDTVRVDVASRASAALPVQTRGVQVVTAEALARLPVRTVAEALDWALSLDVMARSPAQADVAVRGSTFEQVLVLVDGVRVSDPQSGHFHLNLAVPLEQVERIEVLRGVASALYGSDAVGGVINVVTRRGAAPGAAARGEWGSFGTTSLAASARAGTDGLRVDAAADLQRSAGHRPGTDFRVAQGRIALEAPFAGRTLRAHGAHAARDFGADGFYAAFPSYEETRATTAELSWLAPPGARGGIDVRLVRRDHDDDFVLRREDPSFYRNLHASSRTGGEIVGRHAVSAGVRLAGGVEAFRESLRSTNLGDHQEHRAGVYGEAVAAIGTAASLSLGLRTDWHSEFGAFLAPSAAAAWWVRPEIRLRGSAGRAFRSPTWTERFYRDPQNIGSPDLAPERAWSMEIGADLAPRPELRLGATGWVRDASDLIDWSRPHGSQEAWRTRNVGSAVFHGAEVDAEAHWAGTRWNAQAALLRFSASDAEGQTSKYALRPLTRSASLSASRALAPGADATIRGRYSARAGVPADTGAAACVVGAAERTFEVDGRVRYGIGQAYAFADVRNALDRKACDIVARPAPGRALSVGMEWRLR